MTLMRGPFKCNILFMGHLQAVKNKVICYKTQFMIKFCTVCLHNVLVKVNKGAKVKNRYNQQKLKLTTKQPLQ